MLLPPAATDQARALARALGVTVTFAHVLLQRGYEDDQATRKFLDPRLVDLSPPHEMADRAQAVDRIERAIRAKEQIVLFGDYDCDGITSVAILTEIIQALGGQVTPLLAERFMGGYGLSDKAVDAILACRPGLLITCDCGSSDHPRLERVGQAGVDVIVIDHHLVPQEKLPALAFLNPHRTDCPFSYKHLASCGLALSLGAGLRAQMGKALDLRNWLDLVAIGTVADVVPLNGDNRVLVRAGMRVLERAQRPGLRCLAEQAGLTLGHGVTAETIAFDIAPRLNAPGRLASPKLALDLVLSRTPQQALQHAVQVEASRVERRRIQQKMLDEALAEIDECGFGSQPGIVIGRKGWHPGIVGIIAAQITERFTKPTVVVAFDEHSGRGSARAPNGVPVYDFLVASRSAPISFGGHQAAAGVELREEALPRFRELFCEAAYAHEQARLAQLAGAPPPCRAEVPLDPSDTPFEVVTNFDFLEPCGQSNPLPRLAIIGARVQRAQAVRGGHLQVQLSFHNHNVLYGFGLLMGPRVKELAPNTLVNVIGWLRRDSFRGGASVGLRIDSIERAEGG